MVRTVISLPCVFLALGFVCGSDLRADTVPSGVERGKYLVTMFGCNDCHTDGFAPSEGKVPEEKWLLGSSVGWKGPWGTTYPINLRIFFQGLSEDQWISFARKQNSRPPMPSYVLHEMHEADLRSIYQFVRSLRPVGSLAPAFIAPGTEPTTPYFNFELQMPKAETPISPQPPTHKMLNSDHDS